MSSSRSAAARPPARSSDSCGRWLRASRPTGGSCWRGPRGPRRAALDPCHPAAWLGSGRRPRCLARAPRHEPGARADRRGAVQLRPRQRRRGRARVRVAALRGPDRLVAGRDGLDRRVACTDTPGRPCAGARERARAARRPADRARVPAPLRGRSGARRARPCEPAPARRRHRHRRRDPDRRDGPTPGRAGVRGDELAPGAHHRVDRRVHLHRHGGGRRPSRPPAVRELGHLPGARPARAARPAERGVGGRRAPGRPAVVQTPRTGAWRTASRSRSSTASCGPTARPAGCSIAPGRGARPTAAC